MQDTVNSIFRVNIKSGSAESDEQQFAIIKTDAATHEPMPGIQFILYSLESRTNRVPEDSNIPTEVIGSDGRTYYYFGTYTTDDNGYCLIQGLNDGGRYILREYQTPEGYLPMEDRYLQYSAVPQTDTASYFENVFKDQTVSVINEPYYVLPDTGGVGVTAFYAIGGLLLLLGTVLALDRRKPA